MSCPLFKSDVIDDQRLVPGMITSLPSKYTTFGYHHDRLITSWRERAYSIWYRYCKRIDSNDSDLSRYCQRLH